MQDGLCQCETDLAIGLPLLLQQGPCRRTLPKRALPRARAPDGVPLKFARGSKTSRFHGQKLRGALRGALAGELTGRATGRATGR